MGLLKITPAQFRVSNTNISMWRAWGYQFTPARKQLEKTKKITHINIKNTELRVHGTTKNHPSTVIARAEQVAFTRPPK